MDPDVTLATIREVMATTRQNDYTAADAQRLLDELVTAVADLDDGLSKQGLLPSAWIRG